MTCKKRIWRVTGWKRQHPLVNEMVKKLSRAQYAWGSVRLVAMAQWRDTHDMAKAPCHRVRHGSSYWHGPNGNKKISCQFQKVPPEPTSVLFTAAFLSSPSDWCFAFTVIDIYWACIAYVDLKLNNMVFQSLGMLSVASEPSAESTSENPFGMQTCRLHPGPAASESAS